MRGYTAGWRRWRPRTIREHVEKIDKENKKYKEKENKDTGGSEKLNRRRRMRNISQGENEGGKEGVKDRELRDQPKNINQKMIIAQVSFRR